MKKILYVAALFVVFSLVACEKESKNEIVSSSTTVATIDDYVNTNDGHGCNSNSSNAGTASKLVVDFTIDNENGKVDEQATLLLTNKSTDAVSYEWDFGNGDKSTEANPMYSYKIHGNYSVTLKATDKHGKTSTSTKQVTVLCIFGGGSHNE